MQDGVARALVKTLNKSLQEQRGTNHLQEQRAGQKTFLVTLSPERALRISILCTALEMVLQCSAGVLVAYIEDLISQELLPSLVQVVTIFLPLDSTVRDVALSKAARILYLVSKHAVEFPMTIIPAVRMLLSAHVSPDARIDAACSVASLLAHSQMKTYPKLFKELIATSPAVISTLTTASKSAPDEQLSEISKALLQIARSSRTLLMKISSRRDTVVNIAQLLQHNSTRSDALKVAALLLSCDATAKNLQSSNPSTGILILRGLAKVAQTDHTQDQDLAAAILISVLDSDDWKIHQKHIAIDALTSVAYSESNTLLRTEVAFGVCRQLLRRKDKVDEEAKRMYPTVIDFLQFAIDSVRLEALFTLEICTWQNEAATALMAEYAFVDNMAAIISSDRKNEQNAALAILFNCSKDDACAEKICSNSILLTTVVGHATNQDVTSSSSWLKSLEVILHIMKAPVNHVHFKEFTELLPWLATAVSVTESDDLKKKMIKAIIQLSQIYLEGGIPNRFLV